MVPQRRSRFTEDVNKWVVLVVDDEEDNLGIPHKVLTYHGAVVHLARGGAEAIKLAVREEPNIVLLDLSMPAVDGFAVHEKLRTHSELDGTLIIALTARAMKEDKDRARDAGFDGYITKPFDVLSLIQDIKDFGNGTAQIE